MPISMYGVTKVFCERLGEYYHRKFGVDFRGVRLPAVIGPGRGGGGASAYSTLMISEPASGRPYEVFVEEDVRMPLLYIKDAVDCLIQLYEAKNSRLKRRMYCIAGFSPTAREIYDAVKKVLPKSQYSLQAGQGDDARSSGVGPNFWTKAVPRRSGTGRQNISSRIP